MSNHTFRQGYTLIEVLIVIFIISIVTSAALLTITRNNNQQLQAFANELTQMVTLAEEQAMLQPAVLGLSVDEHAFQFMSLNTHVAGKKNGWLPVDDTLLGKHIIPDDMEVSVDVSHQPVAADDDEAISPQIVISTNGDVTPFTIYVGKRGDQPRYAITGDADGHISNKQLP